MSTAQRFGGRGLVVLGNNAGETRVQTVFFTITQGGTHHGALALDHGNALLGGRRLRGDGVGGEREADAAEDDGGEEDTGSHCRRRRTRRSSGLDDFGKTYSSGIPAGPKKVQKPLFHTK